MVRGPRAPPPPPLFCAGLAGQASAQQRPTNADQELGIILSQPLYDADAADTAGQRGRPPAADVSCSTTSASARPSTTPASTSTATSRAPTPTTPTTPSPAFNVGRVFDFEHDEPTLNQVDLNIERRLDLTGDQFDVGGRIELLYGGDARFIHANGLFDHYDPEGPATPTTSPTARKTSSTSRRPTSTSASRSATACASARASSCSSSRSTPTPACSTRHSFTFGAALPFTLTGVTGYYDMTDSTSIEVGVVRGWDDALEDDNDSRQLRRPLPQPRQRRAQHLARRHHRPRAGGRRRRLPHRGQLRRQLPGEQPASRCCSTRSTATRPARPARAPATGTGPRCTASTSQRLRQRRRPPGVLPRRRGLHDRHRRRRPGRSASPARACTRRRSA